MMERNRSGLEVTRMASTRRNLASLGTPKWRKSYEKRQKDEKEDVYIQSTVTQDFVWSAWFMRGRVVEISLRRTSERVHVNLYQHLLRPIACLLEPVSWNHKGRGHCWGGTCRALRNLPICLPKKVCLLPKSAGAQRFILFRNKYQKHRLLSFLGDWLTLTCLGHHSFNFSSILIPDYSSVRKKRSRHSYGD